MKKPATTRGQGTTNSSNSASPELALRYEFQHQFHSGPLPSVETLKGYEDINPGAADRIIAMAEAQSQHRRDREREQLQADIRITERGQKNAFIIAVIVIILSAALIYLGKELQGTVFGAITVVSLLYAFLRGAKARSEIAREIRRAREAAPDNKSKRQKES